VSELQRNRERAPAAAFWRSIRMVSWAFLGIRKGSESQEDMARVHPLHIIAVGIGLAIIFVVGLIVLVQWVVGR